MVRTSGRWGDRQGLLGLLGNCRGELVLDWGRPSRCAQFMSQCGKQFFFVFFILPLQLLRECRNLKLWHGTGLELRLRRICEGAGKLGPRLYHIIIGPDRDKFAGGAGLNEANGYQAGIDDEVKFDISESRHPFRPLNLRRRTGSIDGAWGDGTGREGKATSARSAGGLRRDPGISIMGGQVCL